MKKFSILLFVILKSAALSAQSDLLVNFTGQQIENYIYLSFTVYGGVTCTGTNVEHSVDSIHYETIGTIPGICGSSNFDVSYTFVDSFPVNNQFNYYRINFGQLGNSPSIGLKFVDYGNEFVVISNPFDGSVTVSFDNPNHQSLAFSLYDLRGEAVQSFQTKDDAVYLNRVNFSSRIYFFKVRNSQSTLFKGKIFFQ